jgi:hypothetical protein
LLELVRYIHQNPLKAGLERRLGEHLWTSHRAYLHDQDAMKWLKRDLILERFGEMRGQAKSNLHQFVSNPRSSEIDRILSKQRWPAILGSETFRKDLLKRFKHPLNQSGVANKKELFQTLSPEDLKTIVCDEAGCQGVELLQQRRGRHNDTRRAFIYLCREVLKLDCREIGIHLGGLGRAAVSRQYWLARSDVKSKGSSSQLIHRVQKQL